MQKFKHALLVSFHPQTGVMDDENLDHHRATVRTTPSNFEESGAAEVRLMACQLLDVLDVVLHREDLAWGQGHQLVAHDPDKFKLRTLPLCHPPVCKAVECTGSVATHIVFVFHHLLSASHHLAEMPSE